MKTKLPHQDKSDDELRRVIVAQGNIIQSLWKEKRILVNELAYVKDENETCRKQLNAPEKSIIWYRCQPEDDY
jgi:hypothetical protein